MNARDAALLRRWSEHRDAEAFNDLVSHYADMVYATCKRTLGNASDAEELTQECFLRLATGPDRIRTSLGGWLHSAATSLSINRLRSDARRRKREEIAVAEAPSTANPIWDDLQRHVDEAIAELPEDLREPLIRHFLQRETHDQIAQDLGVTRWTVSRRIATGIERVHKRLTKGGIALTAAALTTLASERMAEAAPASLKASLGRLSLSAVPQSVVVGAAGMTLLTKLLLGLVVVATAGVGTTVAYQRLDTPSPVPSRQQPVPPASPRALATDAKPDQPTAQPAPETAAPATAPDTLSISGRLIYRDTSQGVPGAEVSLVGEAGRQDVQTNERGEYHFDNVQPGTWYVVCGKSNGYYITVEWREGVKQSPKETSPGTRELKLEPGRSLTGIDFAFGRGEGVKGVAVDAKGKPLAGAKVTAYAELNNFVIINTSESREDGAFLVTGFPPTVGLYVWADKGDLVSITNGPYALPQAERPLNPVVLQPEAILRGVVQDGQGKPLAGLNVTPEFGPPVLRRELEFVSGPDGRFELNGMPAGTCIMRVCRDVEIVNSPCPTITLAAGQVIDDLTLTCTVGALTLSGQVVDSRGKGLSLATVNCRGGEPPQQSSAHTDDDGTFRLEALEPGTYTLSATHDEHLNSESLEVAAGTANIRFVLPDAVSIEGRVVDDVTGEPLTGYEIKDAYFEDEMYLDRRYEKPENPDGSFKLTVAQLGDISVVTRREGYRMNVTTVPVDGKQPVVGNVFVRLKPQVDLRGKVHDAKGAPVVGALVFSGSGRVQMEDSYASARSGDDGGFVLPARKLANDTITVFHPNFPKTEMALESKHYAGEPIDVTIVSGPRLACTVLCNGAPFQGAHVTVQVGRGTHSETVQTGPDGKGLIETLLPGEYHAEIQMPPSSDQTTGAHAERTVSVAAGQTTDLTVDFAQGDASIAGEVDPLPKRMRITLTVATAQGEQKYYRFFREGQTKDPSFSFPNLPAGEAVLKVLWTPAGEESDNAPARRYAFSLTAESSIRQEVKLIEGATLWGTVGPLSTTERTRLKVVFGDHASEKPYSDEVNLDHCAEIPLAPDGTFRMEGLQPGVYTVIATACPLENPKPDQLRNVSTVVDLPPQGQEVNLLLSQ